MPDLPPLRPIRNDADHQAALTLIRDLWQVELGSPEGDYFEVLATLVDEYERKHHSIESPAPAEAIKFRMEQQGMDRKDLQRLLGPQAPVADILRGRKELTLPMIRRLHQELGIPAEVLIRPAA